MTYSQDSVVKVLCALRQLTTRGLPRTLFRPQSRKTILPNLPPVVNPLIDISNFGNCSESVRYAGIVCHSEERSDEESPISPPPGADRGRQNGIVATIRPHLSVIPSEARNLRSITARPDSQYRASIVTKSENSVRTPYISFTLRQTLEILRLRYAPLRMTEPGCFLVNGEWSDRQIPTPVSPCRGRDTERGASLANSRRLNSYKLRHRL